MRGWVSRKTSESRQASLNKSGGGQPPRYGETYTSPKRQQGSEEAHPG